MLWEALGAARDLGRVQQIAAVLVRYGFELPPEKPEATPGAK